MSAPNAFMCPEQMTEGSGRSRSVKEQEMSAVADDGGPRGRDYGDGRIEEPVSSVRNGRRDDDGTRPVTSL
jgi:hypothetical protein